MLARLKTELAALCALFVEGHRRHHGKGKHWWEALSWIVINKRPLLSPFPQAERRDIYIADFFPATTPRPVTPGKNVHRLFSALMMMIEELIMNSPAAHNEMVLQNYWRGKMIIIIKSWPIVLSCDWWLDFVADLTST